MLFPGKEIPFLHYCLIHLTVFLEKALIFLRDRLIHLHALSWEGFNSLLRDQRLLIPLLRDCLIHFTCSFLSFSFVTVSFILHALSWRKALIPSFVTVLIHFTCSFLSFFNSSPSKALNSSSFLIHFTSLSFSFSILRDCLIHFTCSFPFLRDCLIHFFMLFPL
ncbi:unnamed protein product [Acanthosepion pharaonis]|uniref:Uncharacterized protein n=1 Tax=Acanthosepion pharaonis TaxID=158019 RepID=A0A812BNX6_ACAPH|nr:unnamed protein product [Sepia pharaonis]